MRYEMIIYWKALKKIDAEYVNIKFALNFMSTAKYCLVKLYKIDKKGNRTIIKEVDA